MPKTITVTIKDIDEYHDDPRAYAIALSNGQVIYIPKSESVEVVVSDESDKIETEK